MTPTTKWKPYCFDNDKCRSYLESNKKKPGHGSCCICQRCGYDYDNCICQYFEEPCVSCKYKRGFLPGTLPENLTPEQQENHRKMVEDMTGRTGNQNL